MIHNRYPVQLTTLEEDFRAIGLLPQRELSESDDSAVPRDIPSPAPETNTGSDMQAMPARHKYAKQPKPKMAPDDTNDHDDPLEAGATQRRKGSGSYRTVSGSKEASLGRMESAEPKGYQLLKNKIMKGAKDNGREPAIARGLAPVNKHAGMIKKESANISRASELVNEVEALINGSQVSEDYNNLAHGFSLIGENCALLADRLVDLAEHYNVDRAISAMESLYNNAIEAAQIVEMKAKKKDKDDDSDDDDDDDDDSDADEALESIKEAFRLMTLQLMDAVEAYDATITKDDDDDDDDSDDDDDDDDSDDDKGGIAARMAKLRAGKGKGPFGK